MAKKPQFGPDDKLPWMPRKDVTISSRHLPFVKSGRGEIAQNASLSIGYERHGLGKPVHCVFVSDLNWRVRSEAEAEAVAKAVLNAMPAVLAAVEAVRKQFDAESEKGSYVVNTPSGPRLFMGDDFDWNDPRVDWNDPRD